jgi:hypothetical protein
MWKTILGRVVMRSPALKRLAIRARLRKQAVSPDWAAILAGDRERWDGLREAAGGGQPILVASSIGGSGGSMTLEGALAAALTRRGANVHFLLCDEVLPACLPCDLRLYPNQKQFVRDGPSRDRCLSCFRPGEAIYRPLGLTLHRYSQFLTPEDWRRAGEITADLPFEDIGQFTLDGMAVGEHALAGALRFYARGTLAGERYADPILRRYLKAALLTTFAVRRLLQAHDYQCAVFHHGIYVPQGLIGEVCRQMQVRVVNWNPAYRKQCFIFSHGDTYHHTLMTEPVSKWENMPWTPRMEKELLDYLKSRWRGSRDWIWFGDKPEEDLAEVAREVGVDFSRPCVGLLTNVFWDAQLHYPANAFRDMLDWIIQTVGYFSRRLELQLIIRVHPAEVRGAIPSRQRVVDEIKKAFPELPPNVFIIPPESQVSTYAAMMACNAVIIYGTKTGVELTSIGIPVIVAGEAWVRNKGITMDVTSAEDYFKTLDRLPLQHPLDETTIRRARRYGYHFFFRRMIPLEFMEPAPPDILYRLKIAGIDDLQPGRSRGLDVICNGILQGTDFIYPAEEYPES